MKSSKTLTSKRAIWRKKGFWGVILLFLAIAGGAAWYLFAGPNAILAQASSKTTGSVSNITKVKRGNLQVTVSGSGTLSANQTVDLSFSTGGTVSAVNVKLGDMVTAGQVLAQIDNASSLETNIASLQLQLLQAQQALTDLQNNADVSLAQAYQDWITAKQNYQSALESEQRMAYARCSQEVNNRYKSMLDRAEDQLKKLTADPESYGTDKWIKAKDDYDTALANYNYCAAYTDDEKTEAKAKVDIAKNKMDLADKNYQILETASGIDPDQLAIDEAKVNSIQTQLDKANEDLEGITLTAPIDGKVVYLASGAGTIVDASKFITLADVSQPQIEVSVDEADMTDFVVGSPATITFDAIPDQTFNGTVTFVEPSLTTAGNYRVLRGVITLDDMAAKTVKDLPLGLSATVKVIYKEVDNVLLVPVTALKENTGKGYEVSVVNSDGTSEMKQVQVGLMDSSYAEVISGLNEGQEINAIIENASSSRSNNMVNPDGMIPPDGGAGGGGVPPQ